jgi:hypothetical protein
VFGEGNDRYDIPKSEIQTIGRNDRWRCLWYIASRNKD